MAVTISVDQLGAELRRRRDDDGLSLRAVEDETGISAATLSRIERGSTPDFPIVDRLAAWLGVTVHAAGAVSTTAVDGSAIRTDEDLKRTIAVHLRANKKLSADLAESIAQGFDYVMRAEIERARAAAAKRRR